MIQNMHVGESIITNGGIYGEIMIIKKDSFIVKIEKNTKFEVNKAFVKIKNKTTI